MRADIAHAETFAAAAHAAVDQRRKYTNEPYIVHPRAVAKIVQTTLPHDSGAICAAWLHDTVEDTKITIGLIHAMFGDDVADLVEWLTDRTTHDMGNRTTRREISRLKLAQAPARAQTIKVADLIDNTKTIVEYDIEFAKVYLTEKTDLLGAMTKADVSLVARARTQIESGWSAIALRKAS